MRPRASTLQFRATYPMRPLPPVDQTGRGRVNRGHSQVIQTIMEAFASIQVRRKGLACDDTIHRRKRHCTVRARHCRSRVATFRSHRLEGWGGDDSRVDGDGTMSVWSKRPRARYGQHKASRASPYRPTCELKRRRSTSTAIHHPTNTPHQA